MQFLSVLPIACGLLPVAIADWVIITDTVVGNLPTPPPSITGTGAIGSWYISLADEYESRTGSWASAQGSSYQKAHDSAVSEFSAFAATATYSIDTSAVDPSGDDEVVYTSVPDWFSALPKDVQQQKELEASVQLSIFYDVLSSATNTASGSASGTSASASGASSTGSPKSTSGTKSSNGSSTGTGASSTHSPAPTGGAALTGLESVKFGLASIAAVIGVLLVL